MIDDGALEVAGEEVARDAQRKLGLLVDERRRLDALGPVLDRLPEALEEDEVALDVLGRGALGGGADDDAALLALERLDDLAQACALVVGQAPRDAQPLAVGDEDDEAAGQRDVGRQAGALGLHRVLDRLDEDLLSALDQLLDLAALAAALELGDDDLVDVEEAVLLQPHLDEGGLHPGQDVVDDALVDVAGDRVAVGALEIDLGDPARPRARRPGARRCRPRPAARAWRPEAAPGAVAGRRRWPPPLAALLPRRPPFGGLRGRARRLLPALLFALLLGAVARASWLFPGRRGFRACAGDAAAPAWAGEVVVLAGFGGAAAGGAETSFFSGVLF